MSGEDIIPEIGLIAFTNVIKVRGSACVGKSCNVLCNHADTWIAIRKELEILKLKVVVCFGRDINRLFRINIIGFSGKLIRMPHPVSRISHPIMP